MYLPGPGPAPFSRKGQVPGPIHFRRSIERPPAVHINGGFATATRMFQRVEGCAVLLPNAIGRGKERVPAVSLSPWPCPLHPLPQSTTAPTPILATSNRKGQVLPHKHFRRGIERQPAIHMMNAWFVATTRMFQRAEGCAVLLFNTAIDRGRERVPAVLLSL